MIKERKPLSMFEVKELLESSKETDKVNDTKSFIKTFSKISKEKGEKLKQELEKLNLIKLKESDICKIIDLMPENATDINKILTEVILDADETNKILETIKQNK